MFVQIFNFILCLVGGIIRIPFKFLKKRIQFTIKPINYLTDGKTSEHEDEDKSILDDDEYYENEYNENEYYADEISTDLIVVEGQVPVESDLMVYEPIQECDLDMIEWSLILIGALTIIICLTRLFKSRRKRNKRKPKRDKKEVFLDCNDLKTNENEAFLDLKNDDNDSPADERGFPHEKLSLYLELKEQSYPDFLVNDEERLHYLDFCMRNILDKDEKPQAPRSDQERSLASPSEKFIASAYEDEHSNNPKAFRRFRKKMAKKKALKLSSKVEKYSYMLPFENDKFSDLSSDEMGWSLHSHSSAEKLLTDSTSDDVDESTYSVLFGRVGQYHLGNTFEGTLENPLGVKDFPQGPHNVETKKWTLSGLSSDQKDIDLPSDKEDRILSLEAEEKAFNDSPSKEKERSLPLESEEKVLTDEEHFPCSTLIVRVQKHSSKEEKLHSVKSKERTFPDVTSEEESLPNLSSPDHKDLELPSDENEPYSYLGIKMKDLPPLPSDDDW